MSIIEEQENPGLFRDNYTPLNITDSDKPGKVTSKKPVIIKDVEDGAHVFVRVAGDKKIPTWVGQYSDFGEIDL